jgi:hypothetical protein
VTVIDARARFARRDVRKRWPNRLGRAVGLALAIARDIGRAGADVLAGLWSMVCALWFAACILIVVFL